MLTAANFLNTTVVVVGVVVIGIIAYMADLFMRYRARAGALERADVLTDQGRTRNE